MTKLATPFIISILFLFSTAAAETSVVINGLPSSLAVGDTVVIYATGGIGPYTWSTDRPSDVSLTEVNDSTARLIVLAAYPSITIYASVPLPDIGQQTISTHEFTIRIPDISFTDGDTAVIPIYYTELSAALEFWAADVFLPYDTTLFKFIGYTSAGTLTSGMSIFSNQVADTIKFGIAASSPIATAQDAVFIYLKFVSKDTVITQSAGPLHFTKFLVNEELSGALIDGILTVDPIPNYPPVFVTTTPGDTIDENTVYNFTFAATDSNGHGITSSLTSNPAGSFAVINGTSGQFTFTTNYEFAGSYEFEVTADDNNGGLTPHQFTIVVNNVNRLPSFTSIHSDTVFINENQYYSFSFTAEDPDIDDLTFSVTDTAAGMSINALTGLFEWTPGYSQSGIYAPTITVADTGGGTDVDTFIIVVQNVNRNPELPALPDTLYVKEGVLFTLGLNATDPDGDSLYYESSGAPTGMTLDTLTGIVSWTPSYDGDGYTTFVTFIVHDSLGGNAMITPFFTVLDSNRVPVFTSVPNDTTILEGETYYFDMSASDEDLSDNLRYYIQSGQPSLLSLDSLTGDIEWTPASNQQGTYTITFVVTDHKAYGTAIDSFTVTVQNVNLVPQFSTAIPDTIYGAENVPFTIDIDATDGDSESLKFSVIDAPAGMTIDSLTGVVEWTPDYTQSGEYNPTFKVIDSLGGYASQYVVMFILNINRLPEFTSTLNDTTIDEAETLTFSYAAFDPDSDSLTYYLLTGAAGMSVSSAGEFQWTPGYTQSGIETVMVMVSDGAGVMIDTAVVTVTDVGIPPVFTTTMNDTAIARFDTLRFTYSAFSVDSQQLYFSLLEGPANAVISDSGALEWVPPPGASGDYLFVVQVTDSVIAITDTVTVRIFRFGDVSGNGVISSFDAGLLLRHDVGAIVLAPVQLRIGNVSGDSLVNPMDASYILQFVVGLIDTFPGGLGKRMKAEAQLSAFSFTIVPSTVKGEYELVVSLNKPSNTYGIGMSIGFDTARVTAKGIKQTALTDSMMMFTYFPKGRANISLAGPKPLNKAGEIIRFTFVLKDESTPHDAVVFTMKRFVLNETDYAGEIGGITLSVDQTEGAPTEFRLGQNYPNPFNPITTIAYQLSSDAAVNVTVFNLLGQEVKTLVHTNQSSGYYTVQWNGTDQNNKTVSSGVYLYKIIAQSAGKNVFISTKKMLLLK
jgi:hypothetical protein